MIHNKTPVLICKYNCLYWLSLLCTNVILPCPLCPPPRGFASNRLVVASASESTGKKWKPLDHNRKHGGYFKPVFRVTRSYSSAKPMTNASVPVQVRLTHCGRVPANPLCSILQDRHKQCALGW